MATHLLNTGHHIPMIGLGTDKLRGEHLNSAVDAALSIGYRLFDTAKVYGNESDLGVALEIGAKRHGISRNNLFITTKVLIPDVPESVDVDAEVREKVEQDVRDSLAKLKVQYLDCVLIHYPKASNDANSNPFNRDRRLQTFLALLSLKDRGLIRSVGVSNFESDHLDELIASSRKVPAVNQIEIHPHFTRTELRSHCASLGVFVQAFTSLARQSPSLLQDPAVAMLADVHECTPQEVLLAWAVHQGIGIIPKSSSANRIGTNFNCSQIRLSPSDIDELSSLNQDKHYVGRCTGWLVE